MAERWPVNKQTVNNSQIIVGLEIGTSKVCVAVGEVSENKVVNIIGIGQAKSRGVRKGEIIDVALAEEDVRNAIVEAEQVADVEIRSVFLGVTGSHIRGFNNTGVHPVVSADREISTTDIQDVIKNARAINLPTDHSVVHVNPAALPRGRAGWRAEPGGDAGGEDRGGCARRQRPVQPFAKSDSPR